MVTHIFNIRIRKFRHQAAAIAVLTLLNAQPILSAHAAGSDDDYLNQLSAEINRPEYLEAVRTEMTQLQTKEKDGLVVGVMGNTIMLEHALQKHAPESLKRFRVLTFVEKNRVFNKMLETDNKLSAALEEILSIASKK